MAVPTLITDLSTTAASNSPVAGDNVFPDLDDFLRITQAFVASIYANTATNGWVSPYAALSGATFTGAVTGITNLTTSGNTILGNAQGDTLNVAAGAIAVGASGNVTMAAPASGDTLKVTPFSGGVAILAEGTLSGAPVYGYAHNLSNTATSTALWIAGVAGSSAGDAYFRCDIDGGQIWSFGLDNSDSDAFVIASSSALGTSNALRITTAGAVSVPGTLAVTGASTLAAVSGTTGTFSGAVSTTSLTASVQVGSPGLLLTPIAEPAGVEGLFYYDTTSKKLRFHNGTAWGDV